MIGKKFIRKHISFDIKACKEIIEGIVLAQSDNWTLLIKNPVDYVADGFILVHNPSVDLYKYDNKNKFREKILLLKTKQIKTPKIDLTDTFSVFKSFKTLKKTISINNKKGDIIWVGKIIELLDDRVTIKELTPKAKWVGKKTVLFKDINCIEFDDDYVSSLLLIADK